MTNTASLRKQIHAACRDLGLDETARHDIQLAACGKSSMRDMDASELKLVVDHLKSRGWQPARKGARHKLAPRADLRLIHVLWRELGEAGQLRDPSRAGLNRFIRIRFGKAWQSLPADIDQMRDHSQIATVIDALRDWCGRAGIELKDQPRHPAPDS